MGKRGRNTLFLPPSLLFLSLPLSSILPYIPLPGRYSDEGEVPVEAAKEEEKEGKVDDLKKED